MPEYKISPDVSNWILQTDKDIDATLPRDVKVQTTKRQVLIEVAKQVGVSENEYLGLVHGEAGEVPREFDVEAQSVVERALQTPHIFELAHDRQAILEATKLLKQEKQLPYWAIEEVEGLLTKHAEKSIGTEFSEIENSSEQREILQMQISKEAAELFDGKVEQANNWTNRKESLPRHFATILARELNNEEGQRLFRSVGFEALNRSEDSAKKYKILHLEFAKMQLERLGTGKPLLLRKSQEGDLLLKDNHLQLPLRSREELQILLELQTEESLKTWSIDNPKDFTTPYPSDEVPYIIATAQTGLTEGSLIPLEKNFANTNEFKRTINQMNLDFGINPIDKQYQNIPTLKETQNFFDNCAAGFIVTRAIKKFPLEVQDIDSLKVAYNSISNEVVKHQLAEYLLKIQTDIPNNSPAICIILEIEPPKQLEKDVKGLNEKLEIYHREAIKQGVRNAIFTNVDNVLVGSYEYVDTPIYQDRERILQNQKKFEANLLRQQASFETLNWIVELDAKRSTPPINWEDISTIQEELIKTHGSAREIYRIEEILNSKLLTDNQKRLLCMIRFVNNCSSYNGGSQWDRIQELERFYDKGYIKEADVIDAHNALALAVHTGYKAIQKDPLNSDLPPFWINSPIEVFRQASYNGKIFNRDRQIPIYSLSAISQGKVKQDGPVYLYTINTDEYRGTGANNLSMMLNNRTDPISYTRLLNVSHKYYNHLITRSYPDENFSEATSVSTSSRELGDQLKRNFGNIEQTAKIFGWDTGMVTDLIEKLPRIIEPYKSKDSKIVKLEADLTSRVNQAVTVMRDLDRMKSELEEIAVPTFIGVPNILSRKAKEQKEIAQRTLDDIKSTVLRVLDLDEKDTSLDKLDLRKPEQVQLIKNLLVEKVINIANSTVAIYDETLRGLGSLPDLSLEVINQKVDIENGVVTLTTVDNQKPIIRVIPIETLTLPSKNYSSSVNGQPLINEVDLSTVPYFALSEILEQLNRRSHSIPYSSNTLLADAVKRAIDKRALLKEEISKLQDPIYARKRLATRLKVGYANKAIANESTVRDVTSELIETMPGKTGQKLADNLK